MNITEGLLTQLRCGKWFSNLGDHAAEFEYHAVHSPQSAIEFIESDVTVWANIEASKLLYMRLSSDFREQFSKWNAVASICAQQALAILDEKMPSLPATLDTDSCLKWLKSVLIGALMEEAFDPYVSVSIFRLQAAYLPLGHLPCGWYLRSAEEFGENSLPIVY